MENYDKNQESSAFQYCDGNSLYGWAMSRKLPVTVKNLNGLRILLNLMKVL